MSQEVEKLKAEIDFLERRVEELEEQVEPEPSFDWSDLD